MRRWKAGDLVWAKYGGWPWWPAVVWDKEPGSFVYVAFVDTPTTYGWVKAEFVKKFLSSAECEPGGRRHDARSIGRLTQAVRAEDELLHLTCDQRLQAMIVKSTRPAAKSMSVKPMSVRVERLTSKQISSYSRCCSPVKTTSSIAAGSSDQMSDVEPCDDVEVITAEPSGMDSGCLCPADNNVKGLLGSAEVNSVADSSSVDTDGHTAVSVVDTGSSCTIATSAVSEECHRNDDDLMLDPVDAEEMNDVATYTGINKYSQPMSFDGRLPDCISVDNFYSSNSAHHDLLQDVPSLELCKKNKRSFKKPQRVHSKQALKLSCKRKADQSDSAVDSRSEPEPGLGTGKQMCLHDKSSGYQSCLDDVEFALSQSLVTLAGPSSSSVMSSVDITSRPVVHTVTESVVPVVVSTVTDPIHLADISAETLLPVSTLSADVNILEPLLHEADLGNKPASVGSLMDQSCDRESRLTYTMTNSSGNRTTEASDSRAAESGGQTVGTGSICGPTDGGDTSRVNIDSRSRSSHEKRCNIQQDSSLESQQASTPMCDKPAGGKGCGSRGRGRGRGRGSSQKAQSHQVPSFTESRQPATLNGASSDAAVDQPTVSQFTHSLFNGGPLNEFSAGAHPVGHSAHVDCLHPTMSTDPFAGFGDMWGTMLPPRAVQQRTVDGSSSGNVEPASDRVMVLVASAMNNVSSAVADFVKILHRMPAPQSAGNSVQTSGASASAAAGNQLNDSISDVVGSALNYLNM